MVNYICETCGKSFKQKGHYTKHLQKKVPCENIKDKIEQMVEEKIEQLVDNGSIEINKNLISKYNTNTQTNIMDIQNIDGMQYLSEIDNNSIDLVLTDPPYITSSETGMGNLHKTIQENKEKGIEFVKTEEEWNKVKDKYIGKKNMPEETMKQNYMKFGSIFGSKYSVQTEYGEWDTSFTMDKLDEFIGEYYKNNS